MRRQIPRRFNAFALKKKLQNIPLGRHPFDGVWFGDIVRAHSQCPCGDEPRSFSSTKKRMRSFQAQEARRQSSKAFYKKERNRVHLRER